MDEEDQEVDTGKNSYVATITRVVEIDYGRQEQELMKQQTGEATVEEAVEVAMQERELDGIEPMEKLVALDVNVDGPSHD